MALTLDPWCLQTPLLWYTYDKKGDKRYWTYSRWDGTEQCAYVIKNDVPVFKFQNARHIHQMLDVWDGFLIAIWDDLPRKPETKWYSRLAWLSYDAKKMKTLKTWPRTNYLAMVEHKWIVYMWEDSGLYNPSSRIVAYDRKRAKFRPVFTLKTAHRGNISLIQPVGKGFLIWTMVELDWDTKTLRYTEDFKNYKLLKETVTNARDWYWYSWRVKEGSKEWVYDWDFDWTI